MEFLNRKKQKRIDQKSQDNIEILDKLFLFAKKQGIKEAVYQLWISTKKSILETLLLPHTIGDSKKVLEYLSHQIKQVEKNYKIKTEPVREIKVKKLGKLIEVKK